MFIKQVYLPNTQYFRAFGTFCYQFVTQTDYNSISYCYTVLYAIYKLIHPEDEVEEEPQDAGHRRSMESHCLANDGRVYQIYYPKFLITTRN